jgi:hypothetical protein
MRDGTTSHVSGSDSADEKGVLMDRSSSGNISLLLLIISYTIMTILIMCDLLFFQESVNWVLAQMEEVLNV